MHSEQRENDQMQLQKASEVWARASRMLNDLGAHALSLDEYAFADRLPYVLDLLAGVRRQIQEHKPVPEEFNNWWAMQRNEDRDAITEMRHSSLKRNERVMDRKSFTQSFSSNGYYNDRPVYSGDGVVVFLGWRFSGGHFDG